MLKLVGTRYSLIKINIDRPGVIGSMMVSKTIGAGSSPAVGAILKRKVNRCRLGAVHVADSREVD